MLLLLLCLLQLRCGPLLKAPQPEPMLPVHQLVDVSDDAHAVPSHPEANALLADEGYGACDFQSWVRLVPALNRLRLQLLAQLLQLVFVIIGIKPASAQPGARSC